MKIGESFSALSEILSPYFETRYGLFTFLSVLRIFTLFVLQIFFFQIDAAKWSESVIDSLKEAARCRFHLRCEKMRFKMKHSCEKH